MAPVDNSHSEDILEHEESNLTEIVNIPTILRSQVQKMRRNEVVEALLLREPEANRNSLSDKKSFSIKELKEMLMKHAKKVSNKRKR